MPKDFGGVMREFKQHELHSGSKDGPVVHDPRQAKAIAISEQKKLTGANAPSMKSLFAAMGQRRP